MKILIIEDDEAAAGYLAKGLGESGHLADLAVNGEDGFELARDGDYDVCVVDRMLPKLDGLTLVERLRAEGVQTPILFLSALGEVDERIKGLRAGGDDYLAKPYAFAELLARVEALVRRHNPGEVQTRLEVADLEMDLLTRKVRRAGTDIPLQPREFRLLEYLMRNAGHVIARSMLLEKVWEFNFDPKTKIVETNVSRLRAKIERGGKPRLIHTKRGSGYVIRPPD